MLLIEKGPAACLRWCCNTCPYVYNIEEKVTKKLPLVRKQVDDVFGGAEAWKNVEKCEVICPKCGFERAYFMQIQIRTADEPMTTFYKCANAPCGHQWRDG